MSNSEELYNTSLKFLSRSLDKLKQNKPVNLALINEINNEYLLMSPYNIPVQPSYLLATNVNAVEPINAKEVAQLTEIFYEMLKKLKEHKAGKKSKLQELADAETAEAAALTARDAAQAALIAAQAATARVLNAIHKATGVRRVIENDNVLDAEDHAEIIAATNNLMIVATDEADAAAAAAGARNASLDNIALGITNTLDVYNAVPLLATAPQIRLAGTNYYNQLEYVIETKAIATLAAAEAAYTDAVNRTAAARLAL
jgi:hypothetical protein